MTRVRPAVRWYGGKARMASWLVSLFPPHRGYVEAFGGGASVLLSKPPSATEVPNDLDQDLYVLYSVLRDPVACGRLVMLLEFTPFSETEFRRAYDPVPAGAGEDVERARRLVLRQYQGWGTDKRNSADQGGFRGYSGMARNAPSRDWRTFIDSISVTHRRLRKVIVRCQDGAKCCRDKDGLDVLHYVVPPYVLSSRNEAKRGYAHEMSDADHERLLNTLAGLKGMVFLSGYDSPLYAARLAGWQRLERPAIDQAGNDKTEIVWLNSAAVRARAAVQPSLFDALV